MSRPKCMSGITSGERDLFHFVFKENSKKKKKTGEGLPCNDR